MTKPDDQQVKSAPVELSSVEATKVAGGYYYRASYFYKEVSTILSPPVSTTITVQ